MEIDQWRREYLRGGLNRGDLKDDPIEQFEQWLQEVVETDLSDPSCMSLATVDSEGQPSQRIVLLKGYDQRGFAFYTNLKSHKAREIEQNQRVSLLFPWQSVERQVIVYGHAEGMTRGEAEAYFRTRPRESQLAAWASHQSDAIESREKLEALFEEMKNRFGEGEIPLPEFWGGYRVVHHAVEFWQGRASRLHDRFIYRRQDDGSWQVARLSP
ncbi:pyridoxamine 5'-phosphate oxidase [Microbulbifer flavimaris]|uniref:Pyridoxine/pyridoxamine 5'-phosphate oxidase n=1 Tax=Microbulbifer flavimaris TaxID=1781068 RepID=A0ABX4I1T8_9GAMM|nr:MULTISPECIES: pyridoxamine 5'-phosphate oxidase [Microbulbifer]KUJ84287.1 pyridoxine 5'-phosphate oxidase [Microbulbifer sp. ZGT114]PCO06367.1 pyridoxamine 5'-phosphate oxidase [Microbulbifer flavimaris]